LVVAVFRGLEKVGRLSTSHFANLEGVLRNCSELGIESQGIFDYTFFKYCNAVGHRLFSNKSDADKQLEQDMVTEWRASLPEDVRSQINEPNSDDEDEDEEESKPWYQGGEDEDEHAKDSDYAMTRVWKEYRDHLITVPTVPLRGPPTWDLSEWSEEEKAQFSLDRFDDDM
jgi:hypothetical protein